MECQHWNTHFSFTLFLDKKDHINQYDLHDIVMPLPQIMEGSKRQILCVYYLIKCEVSSSVHLLIIHVYKDVSLDDFLGLEK